MLEQLREHLDRRRVVDEAVGTPLTVQLWQAYASTAQRANTASSGAEAGKVALFLAMTLARKRTRGALSSGFSTIKFFTEIWRSV